MKMNGMQLISSVLLLFGWNGLAEGQQTFFDKSNCGIAWGCFDGEEFFTAWQMVSATQMKVVLYGTAQSATGEYLAIGFSKDQYMGDDNVIECSSLGNDTLSWKFSYNIRDGAKVYNERIPGEQAVESYFTDQQYQFSNGWLYCSATVNIGGAAGNGANSNLTKVFKYDPNQVYYLFLAHGKTYDDGLLQHDAVDISDPRLLSLVSNTFNPSTCGINKNCFVPAESDCYGGCAGMGVAYSFDNQQLMHIELSLNTPTGVGVYVAVGFSIDGMMGNQSVIECSSLGNDPLSVKFSFNAPKSGVNGPTNIRIPSSNAIGSAMITQSIASVTDGKLYCSAVVNVTGWPTDYRIFKYDPKQNYQLLLATGPTMADGSNLAHHTNIAISNSRILQPAFDGVDTSQCGVTKGCVTTTAGEIVSYRQVTDSILFLELYSPPKDNYNRWVAVGFSLDDKMGNESVVECSQLIGSTLSLKFSYNNEKPANVRIANETVIRSSLISSETDSALDGGIYCSGYVKASGVAGYPQILTYNPNTMYYLLLATGPTAADAIQVHDNKNISTPRRLSDVGTPIGATTAAPPPGASTTPNPNAPHTFDPSTCGINKNCYIPTEAQCYQGCTGMGVAYSFDNQQLMHIELILNTQTSTGLYVAVGFSNNGLMGNQSVIECSSLGTDPLSVKFSFNAPKSGGNGPANIRIPDSNTIGNSMISNSLTTVTNGKLYCSAVVNVTGWPADYRIFKYDPNQNYQLLLATGPTTADGLLHHTHTSISSARVLQPAFNGVDTSLCGLTKGCVTSPSGEIVTYRQVSDSLLFLELSSPSKGNTNRWVAVGFSLDNKMGNESVIECSQLIGSTPSMKFSYNNAKPANVRIVNETSFRPSLIESTGDQYLNGGIYCSGYVSVSGVAGYPEIFTYSPATSYYLLLATGPTNADSLQVHDNKTISTPRQLSDVGLPLGATTAAPTNQPLAPTTQPPPPKSTVFDPALCGVTKGCFLSDPNFGVAYQLLSNQQMSLTIYGLSAAIGEYVAVGFSSDTKMGNESVIECSSIGGAPYSLKFSFNTGEGTGPHNIRIPGEQAVQNYFTKQSVSYVNGNIVCTAVVNITGSTTLPQVFKYNPDQPYYLFLAHGNTSTTDLQHHYIAAISSPRLLSQYSTVFDPSTCGSSKTCYIPAETQCYQGCNGMAVSFAFPNPNQMLVELTVKSNSSNGVYVAVGFSYDNKMGNDTVIECSALGTDPLSIKFSYNNQTAGNGGTPMNVRVSNAQNIGATMIHQSSATYADGVIFCSALVDTGGYTNDNRIFKYDPTQAYFLLLANGPTRADGGGLLHHVHTSVGAARLLAVNASTVDTTECGVSKGCFQAASGPSVSYRQINPSVLYLEIYSMIPPGSTDRWSAVGFSDDGKMGNESVIECSMMTGELAPSMKFSYNDASPQNVRIPDEPSMRPQMISGEVSRFQDGLLYCSAYVNVEGYPGHPQMFTYDPTQMYYLLVASGQTNATAILVHDRKDVAPGAMLSSFGNPTPNGTVVSSTQPPNNNDGLFDGSACGKTKGCFQPTDCPGGCSAMGMSYQLLNPQQMKLEMFVNANTGDGMYVAVGFSLNNQMPDTQVVECSAIGNEKLSMKFSYNVAGTKNNVRIANEKTIEDTYFTNTKTVFQDGQIYCTGLVNVTGWSGSSQVFTYNPDQKYYTLLASGRTASDRLMRHDRFAVPGSAQSLNMTGIVGQTGLSADTRMKLIKAHAIMMVLAWFFFVPTALMFARFLRNCWPTVKPGGILVWFHVHRGCNLMGITLMIAAFVCIMIANSWKWSGPGSANVEWSKNHTMIGIIALCLAWLQPFISAVRCSPSNPRRPYFNWVHRSIGLSAFILATTAIGIATFHFGLGPNPTAQLILSMVPIALIVVLSIGFFIFDQVVDIDEKNLEKTSLYRQAVVFLSVILLVGISTALAVMISNAGSMGKY